MNLTEGEIIDKPLLKELQIMKENAEKYNKLERDDMCGTIRLTNHHNAEIIERLDKRIKEVTPSAPYNIRYNGLVWTPEVFSILKIELNKIKVGHTE